MYSFRFSFLVGDNTNELDNKHFIGFSGVVLGGSEIYGKTK